MANRNGRKPDSVVALERGITVEQLRKERKERLAAKANTKTEVGQSEDKPISDVQRIRELFDPEINDIAAAMAECKNRLERLIYTRAHEKRLDFICEEFAEKIKKHGYDEKIVMGRLKKLLGAE